MPSEELALSTKLRLRLNATRLPRMGLTKTSPSAFARVSFVKEPISNMNQTLQEWGCTEIIQKYCHPTWTEVLTTDYKYGEERLFVVQVMRDNKNGQEPTLIGSAIFEISDILGTPTHTKVRRLQGGGCLYAQMEKAREEELESRIFRFQMRAMELKLRGSAIVTSWNSGPDTVLEVAKQRVSSTGNAWVAVYRSGPVYNSSVPTWDEAEIDLESCVEGEMTWPIQLSVWLYRNGHADTLLGVCETTIEKLMHACMSGESAGICDKDLILTMVNDQAREIGIVRVVKAHVLSTVDDVIEQTNVSNNGCDLNDSFSSATCEDGCDWNDSFSSAPYEVFFPTQIPETPRQSRLLFQQYVKSGCEIELCYAIDFTSSNGDPRLPGSLHYRAADSFNDYEEAITAIGDALSSFNGTKEYPVWGFGAKFGGTLRHIFQCGQTSTVQGLDGVLEAYRTVIQGDIVMSGPTHFGQVIQAAAMRARKYHESREMGRRFCVLLIVTDGMVDDFDETKRKLGVYKDMPLSVVIVGVGRADFKGMHALCNSEASATFVEFRHHQHDPLSMVKAALGELPPQFVDYMTANDM